jgi:hypothetical protein
MAYGCIQPLFKGPFRFLAQLNLGLDSAHSAWKLISPNTPG